MEKRQLVSRTYRTFEIIDATYFYFSINQRINHHFTNYKLGKNTLILWIFVSTFFALSKHPKEHRTNKQNKPLL